MDRLNFGACVLHTLSLLRDLVAVGDGLRSMATSMNGNVAGNVNSTINEPIMEALKSQTNAIEGQMKAIQESVNTMNRMMEMFFNKAQEGK